MHGIKLKKKLFIINVSNAQTYAKKLKETMQSKVDQN